MVFSGSYQRALDIYYELAQNDFIDCNLDLGGLNLAYIDESYSDDELLAKAVEKCLWGAFYNSGESRTAVESILVHESLASRFTNSLSEAVYNTLVLGNPRQDSTNYGCTSAAESIQRYEDVVADA